LNLLKRPVTSCGPVLGLAHQITVNAFGFVVVPSLCSKNISLVSRNQQNTKPDSPGSFAVCILPNVTLPITV
jgi:hypothetical protein